MAHYGVDTWNSIISYKHKPMKLESAEVYFKHIFHLPGTAWILDSELSCFVHGEPRGIYQQLHVSEATVNKSIRTKMWIFITSEMRGFFSLRKLYFFGCCISSVVDKIPAQQGFIFFSSLPLFFQLSHLSLETAAVPNILSEQFQ